MTPTGSVRSFACALLGALLLAGSASAGGPKVLTLVHTGDFHGHLVSRTNLRSDSVGHAREGGLARVKTLVDAFRAEDPQALLFHTGDTIQGGAEVLYTRGQAMVDVLNGFGIDGYAPGNWEFVYGTERFLELFAGASPKAPWNTVAANVYYTTLAEDPTTPYPERAGQRVLPPYFVREVNGLRIGVMGFTTDRGPQVVGKNVTKGFKFTKGDAEVKELLHVLRNQEQVDLVVMLSELGLANNIRLAEANPGIDVVLSSDMHEETSQAVVTSTGTIIVEEGQDGTALGRLKLWVKDGRVVNYKWKQFRVVEDIPEEANVAARIAAIRAPFLREPDCFQFVNPFNGSRLQRPIDSVAGYTLVGLHRSNFSDGEMPAVIEGSSHDFLTDAFRVMAGAQVGAIRGFRYGTHVAPGAISMEDLYHFMPIGAQIAIGTVKGQALKNQIENAANGSLDPNVANWTGGWLFNFSGLTHDFDPYAPNGQRATNILVGGAPLDLAASYSYASYWYEGDPTSINVVPATNIQVLRDADGSPLDVTEVVYRYLQALPGRTVSPQLNRIRLLQPLPAPKFGFSEVQPLRGATP